MSSANVVEFDAPDLICKSVTVYTDRAEVKRLVKTKVKKGANEVVIKNICESIDRDSVRVDGRGPATICEVQCVEKHIVKKKKQIQPEDKKESVEKLKELETQKRLVEDRATVLQRKKDVIAGIANQVTKGVNEDKTKKYVFSLDDESMQGLDKFLAYYVKKLEDLNSEFRKIDEEKKDLQEEIDVTKKNLGKATGGGEEETVLSREVSIILDASAAGEVELDVYYLVDSASWTPSYDIRVETGEKKSMKVHYFGQVKQDTGEDWKDTELSLSTAMPSMGGTIPKLRTLKAKFREDSISEPKRKAVHVMTMQCKPHDPCYQTLAGVDNKVFDEKKDGSTPMKVAQTKVQDNVMTTNFRIARATTLPSDNSTHKVIVAVVDLSPSFEHECVPSKAQVAYLKATATNNSSYPFLSGPTAIFLDNNFVAKSKIPSVSPSEEFSCSLGADPSVRVEYKAPRVFHEKTGMVSKSSVETHQRRTVIKNTHNDMATLRLFEQIPLSTDEKIKVVVVKPVIPKDQKDKDKCEYKINNDNNLEWNIKIKPGEEKDIEIKYTIESPRTENIEMIE